MTITIPLWPTVAVVTTLACWAWASRFEQQGDYDFVTPLFGLAIAAAPVLGWGMFFLGGWLWGAQP